MNTFLFILLYYITIIYLLLYTYYLTIIILNYYNINELAVGSNMIFCCYYLTTLLFFCQNIPVQHIFAPVLHRIFTGFPQKSKKICQFFAIFSLCVSMIYEKFEKKVCQKT